MINNSFLQVAEGELLRALNMGDAIGVKRLFERVGDDEFVVFHNDCDCDIYRYGNDGIVRRSLPYMPYDFNRYHATGYEAFVAGRWLDEYDEES